MNAFHTVRYESDQRSTGNDFLHGAVVVLDAEDRADADQLELHLDAKILERFGREIIRVRVIQPRHVGKEEFGDFVTFDFAEVLEHPDAAVESHRAWDC